MTNSPETAGEVGHRVTRALIVNRLGQLLVLQRPYDTGRQRGCYELPGGKVEPDEDFVSGLVREVKEETNLDIVPRVGLDDKVVTHCRLMRDVGKLIVTETVCADVLPDSPEATLSDEHQRLLWVETDQIPALPLTEEAQYALHEFGLITA